MWPELMIISSSIISPDVASHSAPELRPDPLHYPAQEGPDFLDPFLFLDDQLLELELTRGPTVEEQLREAAAHGQPGRARGRLRQTRRCSRLLFACRIPQAGLLWEERADTTESLQGRHRLEAGSLGRSGWGESLQGAFWGLLQEPGRHPPSLHPQ